MELEILTIYYYYIIENQCNIFYQNYFSIYLLLLGNYYYFNFTF